MSRSEVCPEHQCQARCEGCPFSGPKVGSKGNPTANAVFIGESPGYQEVREGKPLIGPSGKIFHEYVPDDDTVYVLNAMECCPPTKLKNPRKMDQGVYACRDRLLRKVTAHPRRIIVAMGNAAVRALTGDMNLKITQIRGRLIRSEFAELGIFPIVHPAALMRGTGSYRQWREDIAYALDMANGASPKEHIRGIPQFIQVVPQYRAQRAIVDSIMESITHVSNELTADIETTGLNLYDLPHFTVRRSNKVVDDPQVATRVLSVGITPASDPSISYCFLPEHIPHLKQWFEDKGISWCWQNGKYDVQYFIEQYGIEARVDDDTMLMSYALDENTGVHGLETIAGDVLGAPDYKDMLSAYTPGKHPVRSFYERIPIEVLGDYQAIDTSNTAQIRSIYRRRIRRDDALEKLYTRTLLPASPMLAQVERNGIQVDLERVKENDAYFHERLERYKEQIQEIAGVRFNPGSAQQLSKVLFLQMKFPNKAKGSTGADVLEKLQVQTSHPIFEALLQFRQAVKMHGTYVKGLVKWVDANGRIHSTFLIHGTRTGRLASRNPNMQNPPRLPQIRGSFVAAEGYELVECDYSQAELRSLAALSGDPLLVELFLSGRSPHTEMAHRIFPGWENKEYSTYTDGRWGKLSEKDRAYEQYTRCKNVNFGIIYGIQKHGLAGQIDDTPDVAQSYLDMWAETFPVAAEFIKKCRATVIRGQVMTTTFGRRKRVGLVSRDNMHFLQNEAANFPHQSIASDFTLHTAIRLWKPLLEDHGVRIVNLIHDAILMERPIGGSLTRGELINHVTTEMTKVPTDWNITRVPFEAEGEFGPRWGKGNMIEYADDKEAA